MTSRTMIIVALLIVVALAPSRGDAQPTNDNPPIITSITLRISRNGNQPFVAFTPSDTSISGIAREGDLLEITVTVEDLDLPDEEIWAQKQSVWWPFNGDSQNGPEPPPISEDDRTFIQPPIVVTGTTAVFTAYLTIPNWIGVNQARFRPPNPILWDVRWRISISVSNSEDPGDDEPVDIETFTIWAVENPNIAPPNPPPFADAGGNQDVALHPVTRTVEVVLDASRSFDLWNIGFALTDENVFYKDNLQFTWEWVAGPVQIPVSQIVRDSSNPAVARVTLDTPGPPDYVFRVLVDDGVNAGVSSDSATIRVRSSAPTNAGPVAVVAGPTDTVPVGSTITLDASGSWDPDSGDTENLIFRWRQTNEVGGELSPEQVVASFQPLSGQNAATATWRAIAEGTYYFRVLVRDQPQLRDSFLTDQGLSDTATVTVVVAGNAATSGQQSDRDGNGGKQSIGPLGCGGGLFPLAVLPALLWLLRGRNR